MPHCKTSNLVLQNLLKFDNTMAKHLNEFDAIASDAFCGLINCASQIFAYRLTLGGMYPHTDHHQKILDHLQSIAHLIEGYEATEINITSDPNGQSKC